MFPFLWLLQMSFRPNDDIFGYELLFSADARALRARCGPGISRARSGTAWSPARSSTVLSLLLGVPAAYSLSRARFRARRQIALWVLASRMAPPIAFTIPFFLAYRYLGPARHGAGPGPDLPDLQPRAGDLDDADLLRQRAARRSRRRPGSTAAASGGRSCGSRCRSPRRASPRPRCCASSCPGTTSSSR